MKSENSVAVEKVEDSLRGFYEEMKEGCKTYGELRKKIAKEAGNITWSNPSVGECLKTVLTKFFNEEIGNLHIHDMEGKMAEEQKVCKIMNEVEEKISKECKRNNGSAEQILLLAKALNELASAKAVNLRDSI